jgi:cytochrome c
MAGSLEANKIVAGVLTAGIIVVATGVLSGLLYHPKTIAENAFPIATGGETEVAEAAPEPVTPLPVLLASASAEDGQGTFRACAACHTPDEGGANRVGPNLWGVLGADIASHAGFNYSDALQGKDGEWTYEKLYEFLKAPSDWAPGTSMSYAGLRRSEDRANVIAFLRSLSDDPLPLPEPDAAADAEAPTSEGR